jgi:cell division protein YceG involved in septum cleavage
MSTMTLDTMFAPTALRRPRSTVRLTRRGRVVVLLGALLLAFAVGVFVTAAGSVAAQDAAPESATSIVQVTPGESLWSIASDLAGDGDVRSMMTRIEKLNGLDSTTVQAGQRLVVPATSAS